MAAYMDARGRVRFQYTDWQGVRHTVTPSRGTTLKQAGRLFERWQGEATDIRKGILPKPLDKKATAATFSLPEAITEYLRTGKALGFRQRPWTASHAKQTEAILARWQKVLNGSQPALWRQAAQERLGIMAGTKSPSWTRLHGVTLKALFSWAVSEGLLPSSPLVGLRLPSPEAVKPQRRALTAQECLALVTDRRIPSARRFLYEVALSSGLRLGELRQVRAGNVMPSGLELSPSWTKNRKAGFQPLPAGLASRLLSRASGMKRDAFLFEAVDRYHAGRTLRRDLGQEGDGSGRLDFHCLRVTFITRIIELGATVPEAMTLARHSTPVLTLKVYARVRQERLGELAERLHTHFVPVCAVQGLQLAKAS